MSDVRKIDQETQLYEIIASFTDKDHKYLGYALQSYVVTDLMKVQRRLNRSTQHIPETGENKH